MVNIEHVGSSKVVLIAGGGRVYTDIAARFVGSERSLEEIISSPYSSKIVKNILDSGHLAATEMDFFIFGVSGLSRVAEVQLVRKRCASFLIKSGRAELNGKRQFNVAIPRNIADHEISYEKDGISAKINAKILLDMTEMFYSEGVAKGLPEEDLRYMKQQATTFTGVFAMNAHALLDWFKIRTCFCAQYEIRDFANKVMAICKEVSPDLFEHAGPSCVSLGYCPENKRQHKSCKAKGIITKDEAFEIMKAHKTSLESISKNDNKYILNISQNMEDFQDIGRYIINSAVLKDDMIYSMDRPARHHDIIHHRSTPAEVIQGYTTDTGAFVDRKTAYTMAKLADQLINTKSDNTKILFSESIY